MEIIPACPVKSGWQDSNLRPPGPKPGAITGLRYIPNYGYRFVKKNSIKMARFELTIFPIAIGTQFNRATLHPELLVTDLLLFFVEGRI